MLHVIHVILTWSVPDYSEFEVKDMSVTVAVDVNGNSVHQSGPQEWQKIILERKTA